MVYFKIVEPTKTNKILLLSLKNIFISANSRVLEYFREWVNFQLSFRSILDRG